MFIILKTFKIFKKSFLLFPLFFLSCGGDNKSKKVEPGVAQQTTVISKSCAGGSFYISKKVLGPTSSSQLQAGDQVILRGTIKNGQVCGRGLVGFTCPAIHQIDNNRAFVCQQGGTINTGLFPSQTLAPAGGVSTGIPAPSNALQEGYVIIFGNGTKSFGRIVLPSSDPRNPQYVCALSFSCP